LAVPSFNDFVVTDSTPPAGHARLIRSFVRRAGRMTTAQERAIQDLWPAYGVDLSDAALDLAALFGRAAPTVLEIGFGNGETLVATAAANPQQNYLGVEVHRPGVGHLLRLASAQALRNLRVLCADANDVLARLPEASLAEVCLFFPDPWPKKRHHKRRLVQPTFVETIRGKLAPGGFFQLATDWEDYAGHMLSVLTAAPGFANANPQGSFVERLPGRPLTKFERRGQRLGHVVRDLSFRRIA
jgi:tRNA (guanine-N7-)-methyltransferase